MQATLVRRRMIHPGRRARDLVVARIPPRYDIVLTGVSRERTRGATTGIVSEIAPQEDRGDTLGLSKRQKSGAALLAVNVAVGLWLWDFLGPWTPDQWSSSAEVTTAIVALVAAFVALRQLREAQTLRQQQERAALALRREQAQPYVAVFMEPLTAVDRKFQQLVVKNFGETAAFAICLESEPTMVREWQGQPQEVPLPEIPTLVPGQEWRVLWDFFPNRHNAGLPDRHEVTVRFADSLGENFTLSYTLDWGVNRDLLSVTTFGIHHGVQELKKIRERLGS